ncbi:RNA polymerase sigma factor [Desulfosporosinus sp. PR]|uniref:RNA polymerase sigma factor n=1 Tax=Candidatus Desulfosporosinus nitrosoreducens TaxID=3401928 RepID=UPI0027EDD50F|nr:RNA polymerase sigma factor [Desulfosporosinus sp. PR]MDQ7092032.1 RNA polymerase sigma factor [Desulfosporosinus sp. PR]
MRKEGKQTTIRRKEEDGECLRSSAQEEWYRQTMPRLYRFIYSRLQNHPDSEDIVQETYVRCLKSRGAETTLPSYPYLRETAQNLIYDRFRQLKTHLVSPLDQESTDLKTTEDNVMAKTFVQDLLHSLPPDQRQVLQLRLVEGYSRKETAMRLGCSEDSVRGLQYRAIQKLRSLMRKEEKEG